MRRLRKVMRAEKVKMQRWESNPVSLDCQPCAMIIRTTRLIIVIQWYIYLVSIIIYIHGLTFALSMSDGSFNIHFHHGLSHAGLQSGKMAAAVHV